MLATQCQEVKTAEEVRKRSLTNEDLLEEAYDDLMVQIQRHQNTAVQLAKRAKLLRWRIDSIANGREDPIPRRVITAGDGDITAASWDDARIEAKITQLNLTVEARASLRAFMEMYPGSMVVCRNHISAIIPSTAPNATNNLFGIFSSADSKLWSPGYFLCSFHVYNDAQEEIAVAVAATYYFKEEGQLTAHDRVAHNEDGSDADVAGIIGGAAMPLVPLRTPMNQFVVLQSEVFHRRTCFSAVVLEVGDKYVYQRQLTVISDAMEVDE